MSEVVRVNQKNKHYQKKGVRNNSFLCLRNNSLECNPDFVKKLVNLFAFSYKKNCTINQATRVKQVEELKMLSVRPLRSAIRINVEPL